MRDGLDLAELNVADFYMMVREVLHEILVEKNGGADVSAEVTAYMQAIFNEQPPPLGCFMALDEFAAQ